jgi:hypothetical protein
LFYPKQIELSRRFGEVEKSKYRRAHMRPLQHDEIFDISNLDQNGDIVTAANEKRITAIRGNAADVQVVTVQSSICKSFSIPAINIIQDNLFLAQK